MPTAGLWLEPGDSAEGELRIGDVIAILHRNLMRLILCSMLGLACGLLYIVLKTPQYSSTAQILVEPRARTPVDVPNGAAPPSQPDPAVMESQEKVIRSFAVLSRVVARENLAQDDEFMRPRWVWLKERLKKLPLGPLRSKPAPSPPNADELNAMEAFEKVLHVKRAANSYVIDIMVVSEDPAKAARLAQAVAEAYLADQTEAKSGDARQANTMLDSKLGQLRDDVLKAETAVEDFRLRNGLLLATGTLVNEQQLTQVNTGLVTAQAATAEARARFERMQRLVQTGGVPDSVNESFNSVVVQRLREQLAGAAQREAVLSSRLQGAHPDMVDMRSRMTSLRSQLNAELSRILEGARSEFEIARSREAQYVERTDAIKKETNDKNQTRIQLASLERDAAALRRQLENFTTRERDTRQQEKLFTPDARIISPAQTPDRPFSPNKLLALLVSALGGLGAGLAHAMLRAQTDNTVRNRDTVEGDAGLRFVAALPAFAMPRGNTLRRLAGRTTRSEQASDAFLQVLESISLRGPRDGDPYRAGVTRLTAHLRGSRRDAAAKTVLIASALPGEGKSCLALSLAQSEAQAGGRTLLIDADFRHPDLSTVFAPNAASEASPVDLEAGTYKSMVYTFNDSDADFLPLSAIALSLGRQMRLARMAEGVAKLAESYDRVVIDGGALLDDGIASALMPLADQVVLVARSGQTMSADLVDAARLVDVPLDRRSGVVLTMSPSTTRQRALPSAAQTS